MAPETPSRLRFCPRQRRLRARAARPLEAARGAAGENSPAVVAHHITRRGLFIVAFWHLLFPRRRLDPAAPHHRPLPCPVALLSSPPFAPVTHRTAGPSARVPGVRDGRGAALYFEPSRATLGRVHRPAEHRSGDSDGPPDQCPRPCRPHTVSGGLGGGRRRPRSPRGGAHRSPLTAPPRPWHPTHSSLLRGARRHGTFSACLGPPRLHARHRDQGGGLGGPDEARAARLGAACRPSLAGAAHHAQAYAEEPVAPVAHELVARIDRAVQLSHALPTIKFETTNIRPQKRPARAARARRATSEPTC